MPTSRRLGSTCLLRDFMAASSSKPEEQATALLAGALMTSEDFRRALLEPLGIPEQGDVLIDTEVGTGHGRDAIDLELRVVGPRGALRRRVWIEVKVNARLNDARGDRESQLVRYRDALNVLDQQRPDLAPSVLAVLLRRPDETGERVQIDQTESLVLRWHQVADLADACGRSRAGTPGRSWRHTARRPDSPLDLANLDTLLWFVEEACRRTARGEREEIVGVNASSPVTPEEITSYALAPRAVQAVEALSERIEAHLQDGGRSTTSLDPEEAVGEDDDVLARLIVRRGAERRSHKGWWREMRGGCEFWLMPFDLLAEPDEEVALVWAGVIFEEGAAISTTVRAVLEKAGFRLDDDDGGQLFSAGRQAPLEEVVGAADLLGEQAARVADWINACLSDLERFDL
jgi:hypothetical protein